MTYEENLIKINNELRVKIEEKKLLLAELNSKIADEEKTYSEWKLNALIALNEQADAVSKKCITYTAIDKIVQK